MFFHVEYKCFFLKFQIFQYFLKYYSIDCDNTNISMNAQINVKILILRKRKSI